MNYAYIIILSSLAYCFINATVCAQFFHLCTGLKKKSYYFNEFFRFNIMTVLSVLAGQIIFLVYHCRLQFLLYKFFGLFSPDCVQIPRAPFLTHEPFLLLVAFYVITTMTNYHFVKNKYHLSSDKVKLLIAASNIVACCAKYAITAQLQN